MTLRNKTPWQWVAFVTFWTGWLCVIAGLFVKSWLFAIVPFVLWTVGVWCVVFKPVKGKKAERPHDE
jgi:type IV secretory pathway TrbD component